MTNLAHFSFFLPQITLSNFLFPIYKPITYVLGKAVTQFEIKYGDGLHEKAVFIALVLAVSVISSKIFGNMVGAFLGLALIASYQKIIPYLRENKYFEVNLKVQAIFAIAIPIFCLHSPILSPAAPLFGLCLAFSIYKKERETLAEVKKNEDIITALNKKTKAQFNEISKLKCASQEIEEAIHTFFTNYQTLLKPSEDAEKLQTALGIQIGDIKEKLTAIQRVMETALTIEGFQERFKAAETLESQMSILNSESAKLRGQISYLTGQYNDLSGRLERVVGDLKIQQLALNEKIKQLGSS